MIVLGISIDIQTSTTTTDSTHFSLQLASNSTDPLGSTVDQLTEHVTLAQYKRYRTQYYNKSYQFEQPLVLGRRRHVVIDKEQNEEEKVPGHLLR